ncbi:MAG: uracil-DNA glycosylase [Candidatus Pacebacteria bacterium]|nr:uracil-DNA glycosylase [Candidatus Paceibacterota bacterium]
MKQKSSLTTIHKKWIKKCTCELRNTALRAVTGNGNEHSLIVFIGEAPGKKEDETGIPFVGSAGRILDELLSSIRMKREDVYITNIVKYRPPNNRDPLPAEKLACRAWLHEELNSIQPLLIVLLGRHAMNNFFSDLTISRVHGKLLHATIPDISTHYFLPLYHPAATLYNGSLKKSLYKDFKKIPSYVRKIEKK